MGYRGMWKDRPHPWHGPKRTGPTVTTEMMTATCRVCCRPSIVAVGLTGFCKTHAHIAKTWVGWQPITGRRKVRCS